MNEILFALIIFLIVVIKLLGKYYGDNTKYHFLTFSRLQKLIIELSESVNGQIIVFLRNKQVVFYLCKYQHDEFWGIELVINKRNEISKELITLTKNKDSIPFQKDMIKIDLKNNIQELIDILTTFISYSNRTRYNVIKENYHVFMYKNSEE